MELLKGLNLFNKVNDYKYFSFDNNYVSRIKLFKANQLLIIVKNNIFLFDIPTNKTLCKIITTQNILPDFIKVEIIDENKIITLINRNSLIIYGFIENKKNNTISSTKLYILPFPNNIRILTILYNPYKNQLITFGPEIQIYGYKNNNLHLQATIKINHSFFLLYYSCLINIFLEHLVKKKQLNFGIQKIIN